MHTPDRPPPPPPPRGAAPTPEFETLDDAYESPPARGAGTSTVLWIVIGVVVVLLAGLAVLWFLAIGIARSPAGLEGSLAQARMSVIAGALEDYKRVEGHYPGSLTELTPDRGDTGGPYLSPLPRDPWGRGFQYRTLHGGSAYQLRSLGPDGEPDTGDDIPHDRD